MINSFIVQIENGVIKFKSPHHRKLFDNYVAQFNDGAYRLEITDTKSKRSDNQNAYYWMYLGLVSDETGFTPEEIHEWAKGKFLTKDIKELFGDKVRIKSTTTKLKVGEFVEYLMKISQEVGIELPDTSAYLGYSYHK